MATSAKTIYANAINSVCTIMIRLNTGSYSLGQGFWIEGPQPVIGPPIYGYLATAAHVITDDTITGLPIASNIWIHTTFPTNNIMKVNGTTIRVMGWDKLSDVALLRVEYSGSPVYPALVYANSRVDVSCGDNVTIIGYPQGFDVQSVTRGTVRDNKAVPDVYFSGVGGSFMESVLTDCAIYGGNSGGPLINDNGSWIGILSWGIGSDGNLNGGVSSYLAMSIFQYFMTNFTGAVINYPRGYLGIFARPVDVLISVLRGMTSVRGFQITALDTAVNPRKFNVGDIILTVNGVSVGLLNEQFPLFTAVQLATPGTSLIITYIPNGSSSSTVLTKTVTTNTFPNSRNFVFSGYRNRPLITNRELVLGKGFKI